MCPSHTKKTHTVGQAEDIFGNPQECLFKSQESNLLGKWVESFANLHQISVDVMTLLCSASSVASLQQYGPWKGPMNMPSLWKAHQVRLRCQYLHCRMVQCRYIRPQISMFSGKRGKERQTLKINTYCNQPKYLFSQTPLYEKKVTRQKY